MPFGARILRLSSLCLVAGLCLGQSRPAVPVRIPLTAASQPVEPTAGIEEPALYELLRQVRNLPVPAEGQGVPYDRKVLLSQSEAFVGDLIVASGKYVETYQVRLEGAPQDSPGLAWSILVVDADREPIQILSAGHKPDLAKLARVRCVGYFCKIRLDKAAGPDRKTGKVATVQIPVLVGWVLPDTAVPARPTLPAAPWQIFGAAVAAALLLFFAMVAFGRRRVDWRTRAAERRRHRRDWPDKTDGL